MLKLPSIVRRASWNLVDQVISSVTNAVLSFVVARSVDEVTFGGFGVAFTVFSVLVGVSRAIGTAPLPILFSGVPRKDYVAASSAAVGSVLAMGILFGVGSLVVGLLIGGAAGGALVALGVVLPGLLVQDAWRQVFFAEGRPALAALNDTVWAVVQFAAVAALLLTDSGTVGPLVLAWGGAAVAAALFGYRQDRIIPRTSQARSWLREHHNLTKYILADFAAAQGSMQGAMLVIAALGSLSAIGALRGAQVLLGVTNILMMAAVSFALPEVSKRSATMTPSQWMKASLALSGFVSVLGALWGVLFIAAPDSVGEALLGDTWQGVREILVISVVSQFVLAFGTGPSTMLRAMGRTREAFRLNAIEGPLVFLGGVIGVLVDGAVGAMWGFTVAYVVTAPAWWWLMRREVRKFVTAAATAAADRV